ncbi:MAG: PD-(D/E)XK nuclease family protein [Dehalococcoidia bacterium]|nr:PD-(D/E)XK nuclease family protein [Dehalococcoidia bacterium]
MSGGGSSRQVEVIDSTMLGDSLQCLRLYYWRHCRHLVPASPSLPLAYGQAAHASLAAHYRGATAGEALAAFEAVWDEAVGGLLDEDEPGDSKRNPLRWAETFMAYRDFYRVEPFKVLGVENRAIVPLVEDDLYLAVILDLITLWDGKPVVIDHKTTSYMSPDFFQAFTIRHQFTGYILAATRLLELDEPAGLVANCILVTDRAAPPSRLFARYPVTRSRWQLEAWHQEIVSWWRVVRACREAGDWPRNDDRCFRWRPGCPYFILCASTEADYRSYQPPESLFRVEQWNPVKEEGK